MVALRIGLLGASWIGEHAIVVPAREHNDVVVTAVAARDRTRAEAYAQAHGIPAVADDYAALIARDDVDLVYNGLTPVAHREWTEKALAAGKAVLCEKPFAMNAGEAQAMVDAAARHGRPLIEAWHYRFHPLMQRAQAIVSSGVLGPLRNARARFHAPIPEQPGAFRWQASQGGGALLDTGGYTVHVLRSLLGSEPQVLHATSQRRAGVDVDLRTEAQLLFSGGLRAEVEGSMLGDTLFSELWLRGDLGTLTVQGFPLPQWGCRLRLEINGQTLEDSDQQAFPGSTYAHQLAQVVDVMAGRAQPLTGGADAVANMRVLDAIRAAADSGRGS